MLGYRKITVKRQKILHHRDLGTWGPYPLGSTVKHIADAPPALLQTPPRGIVSCPHYEDARLAVLIRACYERFVQSQLVLDLRLHPEHLIQLEHHSKEANDGHLMP